VTFEDRFRGQREYQDATIALARRHLTSTEGRPRHDRATFVLLGLALFVCAAVLIVTVWLSLQPVRCDHVAMVNERPVCVRVVEVEQ
jgi:hypothetical protein